MYTLLIGGFMLGFAGSLHCVGMCGPLSLAIPVWHLSFLQKFFALLTYQCGRIITYSVLGLIVGIAGRSIYIAGFQQWFSVFLGGSMLVAAGACLIRKKSIHFSFLPEFYKSVQQLIIKILKSNKGWKSFLLLGIINGLLPCGMVYIALASALSATQVVHSIGFMAAFGAGTLPAMMAAGYASHTLHPQLRMVFRKSVPFFIAGAGIVLILRGMNLGILFISPELPAAAGKVISCHP